MGGGRRMEKEDVVLGIIPLTDCAPIIIAIEKGFFRKRGISARISREASWANIGVDHGNYVSTTLRQNLDLYQGCHCSKAIRSAATKSRRMRTND
ncbi:MAG: ABC transporter substrate-binding protein [Alphaproteobacteria bacterium]|nr:ABC transporter substrate-binding protein [Alphaproteobacteria bacterium]MDE2630451.1 ABC transporter substrate-binding protein [Alphaproteobacteria bacterium]